MNFKFIKHYKLSLLKLIRPIKLRLTNEEIAKIISYIARTILTFEDYLRELYYLITSFAKFNVILSIL